MCNKPRKKLDFATILDLEHQLTPLTTRWVAHFWKQTFRFVLRTFVHARSQQCSVCLCTSVCLHVCLHVCVLERKHSVDSEEQRPAPVWGIVVTRSKETTVIPLIKALDRRCVGSEYLTWVFAVLVTSLFINRRFLINREVHLTLSTSHPSHDHLSLS